MDAPEKPAFLDDLPDPLTLSRTINGFPTVEDVQPLAEGFAQEYEACTAHLEKTIEDSEWEQIQEHPEANLLDRELRREDVGVYVFEYDLGNAHGWFDQHVVNPLPSVNMMNSGHNGEYRVPVFLS